jgi:hypothetical protein
MTIVMNRHSHNSISSAISACPTLESLMCGAGSRRSYKINTWFDALVHCSECQESRAMGIKAIQPGNFGRRDEIIYQCTQCGAEMSKFAE